MDEIRNAIYQATGVYVDGAAVADEIREQQRRGSWPSMDHRAGRRDGALGVFR